MPVLVSGPPNPYRRQAADELVRDRQEMGFDE